MKQTKSKLFALGIIAHPDDEAFLLAATCRRFADSGKKIGVICATKGEMGADRLNRKLSKKQMAAERVAELKQAGKLIKVSHLDVLNYPDGGLDKVSVKKLALELKKKIDALKPEIILTFGPEGISGHRDHIAIGRATVIAAYGAQHKPKEIWLASVPSSIIKKFNAHLARRKVHHSHFHPEPLVGVAAKKLKAVATGKYKKIKLGAIRAHKSQYLPTLVLDNFLTHEYFEVIKVS